MPISHALVATDAAPRYAKQLASHFGRKIPVEEAPDGGHRLTFQETVVALQPADDHLLIRVSAPGVPALVAIQDVVGSHLEHFGRRDELTVQWEAPRHD